MMPILHLLLAAACLFATGCTGPRIADPPPGTTLASGRLLNDILLLLQDMEKPRTAATRCSPAVRNIQLLHLPQAVETRDSRIRSGFVLERWTLDRCGVIVDYNVRFEPDGQGSYILTVWTGTPENPDDIPGPVSTNVAPGTRAAAWSLE